MLSPSIVSVAACLKSSRNFNESKLYTIYSHYAFPKGVNRTWLASRAGGKLRKSHFVQYCQSPFDIRSCDTLCWLIRSSYSQMYWFLKTGKQRGTVFLTGPYIPTGHWRSLQDVTLVDDDSRPFKGPESFCSTISCLPRSLACSKKPAIECRRYTQ